MASINGMRWRFTTLIGHLLARAAGVQTGRSVKFLGLPILDRHSDSAIVLGDRISLVSDSRGTALGVRSRAILRTLCQGAKVSIGDDTGLSGTVICSALSISIGERCLIGADCMIFDTDFHNHAVGGGEQPYRRYAKPDWSAISAPVFIGDDVFLGARSVICKGVTIGNGTIVAAGSIVTQDIPANSIAAGVPARVLRQLDTEPVL